MGLELNKGEHAVKKIDLTFDIQNFTDTVTRAAVQCNRFQVSSPPAAAFRAATERPCG